MRPIRFRNIVITFPFTWIFFGNMGPYPGHGPDTGSLYRYQFSLGFAVIKVK